MEVFGFFLFLAMVLYLIDKNHGWPKFWRALKALAIVALITTFAGSGYSYWRNRHQRVTFDMSTAVPISPSETVPANFAGWDKQQMVPMFAPDGSLGDIPSDRVNDAIAHGFRVKSGPWEKYQQQPVWKKDKKGKWCLVPPLPDGATLDDCGIQGKVKPLPANDPLGIR
jgi:hypothetical protein